MAAGSSFSNCSEPETSVPFLGVMDFTSDQFPTPRLVTAATWGNISGYTLHVTLTQRMFVKRCRRLTLKSYCVSGRSSYTLVVSDLDLADVQSAL